MFKPVTQRNAVDPNVTDSFPSATQYTVLAWTAPAESQIVLVNTDGVTVLAASRLSSIGHVCRPKTAMAIVIAPAVVIVAAMAKTAAAHRCPTTAFSGPGMGALTALQSVLSMDHGLSCPQTLAPSKLQASPGQPRAMAHALQG
ncbi:uncharacterized protein TrAtP1_010712 [Trichoderma atroviride]|uniref:uncharacterized protein n=1 Tax=Hypocrea atroviridis TaxID=63577 RepID=UPI00332E61A1|nr:hypothetical protein TrAtP1_010712 [Trichoderma atroviride]